MREKRSSSGCGDELPSTDDASGSVGVMVMPRMIIESDE